MRVKAHMATLAVGLALVGCGTAPLSVRDLPSKAAPPAAPPAAAVAPEATATQPLAKVETTIVKAVFAYMEKKHPQAASKLHALEQRVLELTRQQLIALKAVRYQARKDMTLDQLRMQIEGFMTDPDALIADIDKDLTRVQGMSAQDLRATVADLPPVFKELMDAISNPPATAAHDNDEDDDEDEAAVKPKETPISAEPPPKSAMRPAN